MLGSKWKELFKRCDIMEEAIKQLQEQLSYCKQQLEIETPIEDDNPYFNPTTKLYDFQYGKKQQTGGNGK